MSETLVVNLFGGPGSGKSTTAAGVFFDLKVAGIDAELAAEFAKDLTWEKRHATLEDQIYVFGKQYHRIYRLLGEVDVVVTDSPFILSCIYDKEKRPELRALAMREHNKTRSLNFVIDRKKKYNPKGRNQTEAEAKQVDDVVRRFLAEEAINYRVASGLLEGKELIVESIMTTLGKR